MRNIESILEAIPKKQLLALAEEGLRAQLAAPVTSPQVVLTGPPYVRPLPSTLTVSHAGRAARASGLTRARKPRRKKGEKRPPEKLAAMKREIVGLIKAMPGCSSEQLKAQMGIEARELSLPLRQVVAEKLVRATGQARATKYFAAEPKKARAKTKTRRKARAKSKPVVKKSAPKFSTLNGAAAAHV